RRIHSHSPVLSPLAPPTTHTLFPYTTLFRSGHDVQRQPRAFGDGGDVARGGGRREQPVGARFADRAGAAQCFLKRGLGRDQLFRSEEHTSELQSREKLVCRLLLEKRKTTTQH